MTVNSDTLGLHSEACIARALTMASDNGAPDLATALEWVAVAARDGGLGNYGYCTCAYVVHACDLAREACIHCRSCGAYLGGDGPAARVAYWEHCNDDDAQPYVSESGFPAN